MREFRPEMTQNLTAAELVGFVEFPGVRQALTTLIQCGNRSNYDEDVSAERVLKSLSAAYERERARFTFEEGEVRTDAVNALCAAINSEPPGQEALRALIAAGCCPEVLLKLLEIYTTERTEPLTRPARLRAFTRSWRDLLSATRGEMERVHADGNAYFPEWPDVHRAASRFTEHMLSLASQFDARRLSNRDRALAAILAYVSDRARRPHYEELASVFVALGERDVTAQTLAKWKHRNPIRPPVLRFIKARPRLTYTCSCGTRWRGTYDELRRARNCLICKKCGLQVFYFVIQKSPTPQELSSAAT